MQLMFVFIDSCLNEDSILIKIITFFYLNCNGIKWLYDFIRIFQKAYNAWFDLVYAKFISFLDKEVKKNIYLC